MAHFCVFFVRLHTRRRPYALGRAGGMFPEILFTTTFCGAEMCVVRGDKSSKNDDSVNDSAGIVWGASSGFYDVGVETVVFVSIRLSMPNSMYHRGSIAPRRKRENTRCFRRVGAEVSPCLDRQSLIVPQQSVEINLARGVNFLVFWCSLRRDTTYKSGVDLGPLSRTIGWKYPYVVWTNS